MFLAFPFLYILYCIFVNFFVVISYAMYMYYHIVCTVRYVVLLSYNMCSMYNTIYTTSRQKTMENAFFIDLTMFPYEFKINVF